jgi:integrase
VRWLAGAAPPSCRRPRANPTALQSRLDAPHERDVRRQKIREGGFTVHGLRASSVEKLREAGCGDREIEAITGISPAMMITRYSRFADQKQLAKAAVRRLEERAGLGEL